MVTWGFYWNVLLELCSEFQASVREMIPGDGLLAEWLRATFPRIHLLGWMFLLRVLQRSKVFLAMKAVKKRKSFTKALFVTKFPGLWSLFFIVSCLVLMNWFDGCNFRSYQIKEKKKKVGENFHWEYMGQEASLEILWLAKENKICGFRQQI